MEWLNDFRDLGSDVCKLIYMYSLPVCPEMECINLINTFNEKVINQPTFKLLSEISKPDVVLSYFINHRYYNTLFTYFINKIDLTKMCQTERDRIFSNIVKSYQDSVFDNVSYELYCNFIYNNLEPNHFVLLFKTHIRDKYILIGLIDTIKSRFNLSSKYLIDFIYENENELLYKEINTIPLQMLLSLLY
jgi:hypothetical protein